MRVLRRSGFLVAAALFLLLSAPAAQADFLGLETGDVINTIGYTIPGLGGSFVDAADTLDVDGSLNDITTTSPEVLGQIGGGGLEVNLDLAGESLTFLGPSGPTLVYSYTATFNGRAGVDDIVLTSPTSGGLPEQDGRDLVIGEFNSDTVDVTLTFDTVGFFPLTLTFGGTFDIVGGDPTFLQAFGGLGMSGDLADIIGSSSATSPSITSLLADGHLFSDRTVDLSAAGCGGTTPGSACTGPVSGQTASFTFSGTGEVIPQDAAPFVPEPTTATLMTFGLIGWLAASRRR